MVREVYAPREGNICAYSSPFPFPLPSLDSIYLPIPICQVMRGMSNDTPISTVAQITTVHSETFHRTSPRAHRVTTMWSTSPIRSGVSKAETIFSCSMSWPDRYRRTARRRKKLTRPRRPQTCASCTTVTFVARGNRCGGIT